MRVVLLCLAFTCGIAGDPKAIWTGPAVNLLGTPSGNGNFFLTKIPRHATSPSGNCRTGNTHSDAAVDSECPTALSARKMRCSQACLRRVGFQFQGCRGVLQSGIDASLAFSWSMEMAYVLVMIEASELSCSVLDRDKSTSKNRHMDREQVIARLRTHERQLKEAGIVRLSLFGSTARNEAGWQSDVDLLAVFDETRRLSLLDVIHIEKQLADLLGCSVDLSEEGMLKPHVQKRIEAEAVRAF